MNFGKLAPWNWFKKEEDEGIATKPVVFQNGFHISDIQKEFDKMVESMRNSLGITKTQDFSTNFFKPSLDIVSNDKKYTIAIELPGIASKDIDIEVADYTLRIKGEKRQEKKEENDGFYKIERSYGSFQRVLNLPEDSDIDNIISSYKDGVLTIDISRKQSPKENVKKIEIKNS